MKYILVLGDGMADEPIASLGDKTPLEYADTPNMDRLAAKSEIGMAKTIPEGMKPGSDTANLAVLGYNPKEYYTGRSPLEALSIGVPMEDTDIAIRCNIVTVSEENVPYADQQILDHSSGEISTEDAAVLLDAVKAKLQDENYQFWLGTSYRHCTIWKGGQVVELTPPHDILGKTIGEYLPEEEKLREMMEKSYDILNNHPLNVERAKKGLNKANSLWFWGAGTKPILDSFEKKFHKKGAMISAVDLLKGIAVGAEMTNIKVEGADGTLDTNYEGKADAAVKALLEDGFDFVYIHVEAPDEMGHQGSVEKKIQAIESIDKRILSRIINKMNASGEDYRILVLPDHPTPIRTRTHSSEPVPYMLYDSTREGSNTWHYNEKEAAASGRYIEPGYQLIRSLLED
ncbi:MAG: cofactor-independent phosphoglycerate mutase [Lachnospiraceae bacterium]|nr:cofactor-independent phosphoglycerate mutase [Lachnospiraceae bacterium]